MNSYELSQNNVSTEGEKIIQQLDLKAGKKLKIKKIITSYGNRHEVGEEIEGILEKDVKVGMPIEFGGDDDSSNIKNIWAENGKYFLKTLVATYEIISNPIEKENKKSEQNKNSTKEDMPKENFLNKIEQSIFEEASDGFILLRDELKNRYNNGNTQFFFEAELSEFDSLSMKFKDSNNFKDIKEAIKYLPLVLDNMVNAGRNIGEIKDDDESFGKLVFLIKNLCEKFKDFGIILDKEIDSSEEIKKEIIQDLFISADNAEKLWQKINSYRSN